MPLRPACLAIALLLSPLAAAQPPSPYEDDQAPADPRVEQAYRSYHARAAEALAAQGDARGLAIAALLLPPTDGRPVEGVVPDDEVPSQPVATDPRVALWRQQASAAAGGDVLADALLSSIDVGGEADVTLGRAAAARWRAAEPDNLAPRLAAGDPIEMVLADAGSLRRFDLHYLDTTRAIAAALRAHPPTEAERALLAPDGAPVDEIAALAASGMASALTLPSLRPLFEACSPAATDDMPARADACRGVAEAMRSSSDSALGESLGLSLARRMATTPDAIAAVDADGRRYAWRTQQMARVAAAQPRGGAAGFARLLADPSIRNERQLADRVLARAGVPLEPPADWQLPPRE